MSGELHVSASLLHTKTLRSSAFIFIIIHTYFDDVCFGYASEDIATSIFRRLDIRSALLVRANIKTLRRAVLLTGTTV